MLSNKTYRKYGDIWGEIYRLPRKFTRRFRHFDLYGRRQKNNSIYYRFTFYVGRFGFVRRRKTRYGRAFDDKQKLKIFYCFLGEAYMRQYWSRSLGRGRNAIFYFCHLLESRLDSLALRCNFAFNSHHAKTIVELGLVSVNGRPATRPSFQIKRYDLVQINVSRFLYHRFFSGLCGNVIVFSPCHPI